MSQLKQTPLHAAHGRAGARFVDFGGWDMPVQYSSIVDEHLAVRRAGGVFDISHMGEVEVTGTAAGEFLNGVLTNDTSRLEVGQAQYSLMCNPEGGVIDDLYVYRLEEHRFLLIINASRIDPDWEWLQLQYDQSQVQGTLEMTNTSEATCALALQGPRVPDIIEQVVPGGSLGGRMVDGCQHLAKNEVGLFVFQGQPVPVARTGYTGEDGFEIVCGADVIESLWNRILDVGHAACLQPAGLGARDTLRTEVCYPLYGHELDASTTPLEAGLGFFVALDKPSFPGRDVLREQKEKGVSRKCVAFQLEGKGALPRPDYPIWARDAADGPMGKVTSGTQSPSLQRGIGLGYVPLASAKAGTLIDIEVRGRRLPAEIVRKPIFRKPKPAS